MSKPSNQSFPHQIKYIVWNEACERYSYYGMKSILVIFFVTYFQMDKHEAVSDYHFFSAACYIFPLLGAYLSDRYWGKYKTIFLLSLVYCLGHVFLAVFEHVKEGFYVGLALIALGAGGIKPCVSAHVGDQFKVSQKALLNKVFSLFYFMINFGSLVASLVTPWTLQKFGPAVAFGIPGGLMLCATIIFRMGKDHFVHVPPSGKVEHGAWAVLKTGLTGVFSSQGFVATMKAHHPARAVEDVLAVLSVSKLFVAVSFFWALFEQHGSSWVVQASQMNLQCSLFGREIDLLPSQLPGLNPLMVMTLIPLFTYGVYPFVEKTFRLELTSLRKMIAGMFVAALAFMVVMVIQYVLDAGHQLSVLWQIIPYLLITIAEVMVSITGLHFAYTQAPRSMRSTIMSMWLLTVFVGNMIAALVAKVNVFTGYSYYLFFAVMMGVAAVVFLAFARRYTPKSYMED